MRDSTYRSIGHFRHAFFVVVQTIERDGQRIVGIVVFNTAGFRPRSKYGNMPQLVRDRRLSALSKSKKDLSQVTGRANHRVLDLVDHLLADADPLPQLLLAPAFCFT